MDIALAHYENVRAGRAQPSIPTPVDELKDNQMPFFFILYLLNWLQLYCSAQTDRTGYNDNEKWLICLCLEWNTSLKCNT